MRRNAEATRASILDAAERVFAQHGFAGAAASAIARDAGVTKSLIHHYFGLKEQLWDAVKVRRYAEYVSAQQAVLSSPMDSPEEAEAVLTRSLRTLFDFLASNPRFVRLLSWVQLEGGQVDLAVRELPELGMKRLREAQSAGMIRPDVDPSHMVAAFFALIEHWFQARERNHVRLGTPLTDGARQEADEAYFRDVRKMFLQGLLPQARSGSAVE